MRRFFGLSQRSQSATTPKRQDVKEKPKFAAPSVILWMPERVQPWDFILFDFPGAIRGILKAGIAFAPIATTDPLCIRFPRLSTKRAVQAYKIRVAVSEDSRRKGRDP
jgi:hypothetical protein